MKCPGFDKLIDFLEGRLSTGETRLVKSHLDEGCKKCVSNRSWYENVKSITRSDELFRPAPQVRNQAVKLFEEQQTRPNALVRTARAAAQLVFDSMQKLSFAGTRPADVSGRQLVYKAGEYNVDIQIAASAASGAEIAGQILREGEKGFGSVTGLLIDLSQGRKDVWSTVTNEFGEFMMHEVDSGRYDVRIETGEMTVVIEGLPVLQQ